MNKQIKMSIVTFILSALCCAGCAKHDVVRQEESIRAVAPAAVPLPEQSAVSSDPQPVQNAAQPAGTSGSEAQDAGTPLTPKAAESGTDALPQTAFDKIYFDFDSYALNPAARETLSKTAALLQKGSVQLRIEGNTDEIGSDDYNLALGERRASAALNYLKSLGVLADRLSVISYGREKPADLGGDEAARAKNRRDEFVVITGTI